MHVVTVLVCAGDGGVVYLLIKELADVEAELGQILLHLLAVVQKSLGRSLYRQVIKNRLPILCSELFAFFLYSLPRRLTIRRYRSRRRRLPIILITRTKTTKWLGFHGNTGPLPLLHLLDRPKHAVLLLNLAKGNTRGHVVLVTHEALGGGLDEVVAREDGPRVVLLALLVLRGFVEL